MGERAAPVKRILNTVILGASMTAAMAKMNLPPVGRGGMAAFAVLGFAVGIVAVWLYAAIRPRFGPGPKTDTLWGLGEVLVASVAGAYFYKE